MAAGQQTADTSTAAIEQELLGWQNIVKEVISTKWQEEQQKYWKTYKSWKSSK